MMRARPFRPTLRTRLTLSAAVVAVALLAVASFTLVTIQGRALTKGIDESLRQTADNLAGVTGPGISLLPVGDPEDTFVQVLDPRGNIVSATSNTADAPVVDDVSPGITTSHIDQPRGRFRILTRTIEGADGDLTLIVGKNLDDVTESVHILIAALAAVSPVLILLLTGLSSWLVGRTLRPVDAIRQEVQGIGGSELHRRVPVPDTDDEIATLARTMNEMLGRVQESSDQQQRFVDDASHELRTPLTRMIADLDVALAHPDDDEPATVLRRILADATDLHWLLEDLLFLARGSRDCDVPTAEVDLDDIALHIAADIRKHTTLTIDTRAISAASTQGDARSLHRAIANIVNNAAQHARSRVAIAVASEAGTSRVTVDDDGAGIPTDDRHRVFERFARLDEARDREHGGAGLGLAIANEIIHRHGGSVAISDSPSGGARFTISLRGSAD